MAQDHLETVDLLEQLGVTPEAVAQSLRGAGVQGVRHTVRMLNPIVRYLQAQLRERPLSLEVVQGSRLRIICQGGRVDKATLPEPVRLFLQAFDQGAYRELLIPETEVSGRHSQP